ncbi:DUF333 domain-containing protein [Sedimentitalea arenosa]|uniref:DUF333 domain-containing protein n=1 Tax=Sedimentitalea arenosa TaxID=2798803 RepID=A0A8J7LPY6_9RHOB|nr:DUF333 domain-containing protein [Arenibacterium arenosum]MBJ6370003.1 DUF333 domain-containing protein [Arenibacterium arenosum]
MRPSTSAPLALTGLLLAACAEENPATLANPAATFCIEEGGRYQIRKDAAGAETGICVLPDGTEVDAWAHFRANAPA